MKVFADVNAFPPLKVTHINITHILPMTYLFFVSWTETLAKIKQLLNNDATDINQRT